MLVPPRFRRQDAAARARFALGCLCAALSACAAPRPTPAPPPAEPEAVRAPDASVARTSQARAEAPAAPALELPADFASLRTQEFERELVRWTPAGEARAIGPQDLARLAAALRAPADAPARAALVLARARDPRGLALLLALLEERRANPDDAASLVAARALGAESGVANASARLLALARGKESHPRLSVRVECAASAALLGRDEALPILLDALRLGATAPQPAPALEAAELEAVQRRAADVLAARLGVSVEYAPEAGAQVRGAEVERLAPLVAARLAAARDGRP
ncbi:MAG: hypothetical protein IPJ77_16125 [Planctomycetes bacterium]|nr:hypothetical protein [Planctomycetota bacterium]